MSPGGTFFELGCGAGELSLALLARGARLTALDLSPGMVRIARERARCFRPDARVRFVVAPAEATGLPDAAFDLAVGKWVLHHVDLGPVADELHRVVRPGGRGVFAETSGLNPLLVAARRHLVGRLGVHRCGTIDESPLSRKDLERLATTFMHVRATFPSFWLAQLLDRHVLAWRWPTATRLLRRFDELIVAAAPRVRPYGHWMLVEVEATAAPKQGVRSASK